MDSGRKPAPNKSTTGGSEEAEEKGKGCREDGRAEANIEEEMSIRVEENIYKEVKDWIGKPEDDRGSDRKEKKKREKKKKEMKENESSKKEDIRKWLGSNKDTRDKSEEESKGKKRPRYLKSWIGANLLKREEDILEEKEVTPPRRVIVENRKLKAECKGTEDIRNWLGKKREQGVLESNFNKSEPSVDEDNREVVKEKVSPDVNILKGRSNEVLSKHGLHLTRGDFRSLSGTNYLNDKIIDQYLQLLQKRSEEDPNLPRVHACTTYLYSQLKRFGLEEGCRRTVRWTPADLLKKELIFFPIHHLDHWSLIIIETGSRTVHYFDSLEGSRRNSSAPGIMKRYIEKQHQKMGEEAVYRVNIREDAPLQHNGVDCGVFVCQYAERVSRRSRMDFGQRDMGEARERMTEELLGGKIAQDWGSYKRWRKEEPSSRKLREVKPKRKRESKQSKKQNHKDLPRKGDEETKTNAKEDGVERKKRINWPKANSPEWGRLDTDLSEILKSQCSSPENKSVVHPVIIYTLSLERFGEKGEAKE